MTKCSPRDVCYRGCTRVYGWKMDTTSVYSHAVAGDTLASVLQRYRTRAAGGGVLKLERAQSRINLRTIFCALYRGYKSYGTRSLLDFGIFIGGGWD